MTIKLSNTSKLGVFSWSLQAGETCPGSIGKDGALVPACSGCYAMGGNYRFKNVKAPRAFNREDWKRDEWAADMVQALQNSRFFRWFDSGDLYTVALAEKVYSVMMATPWVNHWLPTRMYKFKKFAGILARMQSLPNVVVRFSSDSVTGECLPAELGTSSVITPTPDSPTTRSAFVCGAYSREGKCADCRACYDKNVQVIAYPAHGRTMAKVVREQSAKISIVNVGE